MNSIEEDIERIAKLITTKFNNDYSIDNVDKEAIEELLKAYKELEEIEESHRKENGELREKVKQLEEENKKLSKANKIYIKSIQNIAPVITNDYIAKSKVKEKIEKLDKEEKRELKGTKGQDRYYIKQKYMYKRKVLEELLREE